MTNLEIIIPVVVGLVSAVGAWGVAKTNNKKDLTISDRQQLSEDEKAFRAELREVVNSYKTDLEEARGEIKALREEIASLHKLNLELTLENKQLQAKVDDLRNELQRFKGEPK